MAKIISLFFKFLFLVLIITAVFSQMISAQDCAPTETYNIDVKSADGTTTASESHSTENTCK
ncbi:hypothetical protein MKX03_033626 [Papaver bracteatum]|nr:hypothetical protein MKX03_033626 [Papaver bracteatum]